MDNRKTVWAYAKEDIDRKVEDYIIPKLTEHFISALTVAFQVGVEVGRTSESLVNNKDEAYREFTRLHNRIARKLGELSLDLPVTAAILDKSIQLKYSIEKQSELLQQVLNLLPSGDVV